MPGLVPGIHVWETNKDVDRRDTPGTKCPGAAMTRWIVERMKKPREVPGLFFW
jgi:hypothetical protein